MSVKPTNESKLVATVSVAGVSEIAVGGGGAEEEEESTLVEISPTSSSSSPTTVSSLSLTSRGNSSTTGEEDVLHPKPVAATENSFTESSTIGSVEEHHPHEQHQQTVLAPVAPSATAAEDVQVVTEEQQQQSRTLLSIQSSSSLSTPSSSEEYYDVCVSKITVSNNSEEPPNISTSSKQLNNNSSSTREQSVQESSVDSAFLHTTVATTLENNKITPEPVALNATEPTLMTRDSSVDNREEAPLEIVQIFPSTKVTRLSSSATSSSSDTSDKSEVSSNSEASTNLSTSSSPSVSPLAVDQHQQQTLASPLLDKTQGFQIEVYPTEMVDTAELSYKEIIQQVPQGNELTQDDFNVDHGHKTLVYHDRGSPQRKQSSLKKYKKRNDENQRRRVSFPNDAQLITGYLEPIDPWACVSIVSTSDLTEFYKKSCAKHLTEPLPVIIEHIKTLDMNLNQRVSLLSLKDQSLNHGSCEALEEVFKRVQYKSINLSHAGLDDNCASVLFDMIEYYEATNELDFSDNLAMTNKSWLACINMLKKSQSLNVLVTRGPGISEHHATNLAKALNTSALHTLKLEHCELTQRPLATLCNLLKRNTVLKELSLAHNQLTCDDARNIASLIRYNYHIQLLDISNNNIGDKGVEFIVTALIDQSIYFKKVQETKRRSEFSFADLSSSLNSINSNKSYFPNPYGLHQFQQTKQYQQLQQQQHSVPKKRHSKKERFTSTSTDTSPPVPEISTASITSSLAPRSPPTSTKKEFECTGVIESLIKLPTSGSMEEILEHDMKSTNNDSGINSSVSSEVDQTNSDHSSCSKNLLEPVTISAPSSNEEERFPLVLNPVIEKSNAKGNEVVISGSKMDNVVQDDSGNCDKGSILNEEIERQTLDFTFDLDRDGKEHDKCPKKARLAKQDSVLSEFESSLCGSKEAEQHRKTDIAPVGTPSTVPTKEQPMEEDLPEICTDYDDDESLKIVEENLLVDRRINDNGKSITEEIHTALDTDDSTPITPLTIFKKDELQLHLEKARQREQEEIECTQSEPPAATEPVASLLETIVNDANKEIASNTAPEKSEANSLRIIDPKEKQQQLSRSLDSTSSSVEFDNVFHADAQTFPSERSFSSESLNSETSVDSNDSKSSLKIHESKFAARNGTLERQQSSISRETQSSGQSTTAPCGLQVLMLWNNEITQSSAHIFADLIENTSTLEILNVGCNLLCNDFVMNIKSSVKVNSSLTSLGLQGAHLSDNGAKVIAEVIEFGGNSTLQRIDLRNNNILAPGLDSLNDALKSNKTVTRIDLDDVPRRAVDNAIEVGPEYNRLLNNIRAQCERNKHPLETSEPISTSIKRVKATHLNSRKISLTCSSIRAFPSSATAGEKHHHHLLDPSKKTGGRLRSPLPSPIPSPIASPVPSPSRNRFQVTRVGESASGGSTSSLTSIGNNNNASTSPSPSSMGSSPTLFFAANSRFRVVTVEEPAPSMSSSSVPNYQLERMTSSSISPSPLVSHLPPTSSSSAPALSSFAVSPKSTSSPIAQQQHFRQLQQQHQQHSIAANNSSPTVLSKQQPLLPQLISQHIPPLAKSVTTVVTPIIPPTPKTMQYTRPPSTPSSMLNDSTISSTSIESPDLEVKRFMAGESGGLIHPATSSTGVTRALSSTMDDSCCSSISSSIDSIDNVLQFNNTSISSTEESLDMVVSSPSSSSLSVGSVSTAPLVKPIVLQQDSALISIYPEQQNCSTPVASIKEKNVSSVNSLQLIQPGNLLKVKNNSLSSLEISTSSQESLYDLQDLSSISVSSGGSSSLAVMGTGTKLLQQANGNSNESTLTSNQNLEKDKQAMSTKQQQTLPRVRKTSWIPSLGNHPVSSATTGGSSSSGGSAYPPAVEKLLAIFSPANLFSSSKSSPPNSEYGMFSPNITSTGGGVTNTTTGEKENAPSTRKESPIGGLFRWSTKSLSMTVKDEEKVLKVNISPENTITPQTQLLQSQSQHQQHSPQLPAGYNVENIPSQLKAEIKENISPENTITNKLLANPSSSPSAMQQSPVIVEDAVSPAALVSTHPKVIFHLGDDYDESEDDIDTLTSKYGGGSSIGIGNIGSSGDFSRLSHQQTSALSGKNAGCTTTNSSGISISSHITEESPTPASLPVLHGFSSSTPLNTSHLGQLARDSLITMFKNPSLTSQDSIRSMDSLTEMTATDSKQPQRRELQNSDKEDTQAQ